MAIHNQVRGLNPWPRASTSLDGARLIVMRTVPEAVHASASAGTKVPALRERSKAGTEVPALHSKTSDATSRVEPELQFRRTAPGTVMETTGDAIRVATGDGVLLILALQPEGKRVMTAREFLAGRLIPAGTRLS
jgi:methionyl-tRNA formyltransferase